MQQTDIPAWGYVVNYLFIIWSYMWKGIALWRAAKHGQRNWFIVMLVLPTLGILELIYLFRFSKKRMTWQDIRHWFHSTFFTREKVS
jgi:methionyl-tRNA synthetase